MRSYFLALLALLSFSSCITAQSDNTSLLTETETRLKDDHASVSAILTDEKYLSLHPETSFRKLIEKYAKAETLVIHTDAEPGKKIKVLCTVKDAAGALVKDALVYLYQTDYRGWYAADAPHVSGNGGDVGHARLFGYVKTDSNGQFVLHTVKPSGYPSSDLPAHIHVHVSAAGYRSYVNEFLFDDDDRLVGTIREQAIRNQFQIANPEKGIAPFEQQFSYTIILNKQR